MIKISEVVQSDQISKSLLSDHNKNLDDLKIIEPKLL